MNVLILTPDAVGSTLLQRLLTIYMQFHEFDQPVINLHELTNGLFKFYSPDFNQEIISRQGKWGYHQTLPEIIDILESVDHYKTARLAQYHIVARGDSLTDQLPFYRYLNENFFIISCRRQNLFEHALSHSFNDITKKLNVFNHTEKITSFYGIYRSGVKVHTEQMIKYLQRYSDYIHWCDRHFSVGSYFYYEKDLPNIEKYILELPVFGAQNKQVTWQQNFGLEFEQWNRCHYYSSDIGALAMGQPEKLLEFNAEQNSVEASVQNWLPTAHKNFLNQYQKQYHDVNQSIFKMMSLGILNGSVPIKKQTLKEKLWVVRNLSECIDLFNTWILDHPELGDPVHIDQLHEQARMEYDQQWNPAMLPGAEPLAQLPTQQ